MLKILHPNLDKRSKKKSKPPPIFEREHNSNALVKKIVALVRKDHFYVAPKGNIHETKLQSKTEDHISG